eukprot:Nitzschia sp. Nitz4//scaffold96_size78090//72035//73411//NITZ4_005508-RA/size78090-processed-gene-0.62-mRNA-1//-1//CDS//3329560615//6556//frame0
MGRDKSKKTSVQLGFSVPMEDQEHRDFVGHHMPHWRDWDGGQIGGRPSWLQPRDLPKEPIMCLNCERPMSFVCQLYAPTDDTTTDNEGNDFHRTIYVFGCSSSECATSTTGAIRVLRVQLPRENPFYPFDDPVTHEDEDYDPRSSTWAMHLPEAWDVSLCQVCGQKGNGKCPIQGVQFCGKHHQKEHKKYIFDKQQQLSKHLNFSFLPSVYAESELAAEEEPAREEQDDEDDDEDEQEAMFKSEEGADDEDRNLEQEDLNEMTGAATSEASKDPVTMAFYGRVNGRPDVQEQCLRYLRWPTEETATEEKAPLWIRGDKQPSKEDIPNCPYCGSERRFEFQLMPQMLHFLLKDHELHRAQQKVKDSIASTDMKKAVESAASIMEQAPKEQVPPAFAEAKEKAAEAVRNQLLGGDRDELSWGIVSIYTCTASCGAADVDEGSVLGAYKEEFAWKQPSLDH